METTNGYIGQGVAALAQVQSMLQVPLTNEAMEELMALESDLSNSIGGLWDSFDAAFDEWFANC
ncbi:MAG: hypothetical protein IT353_09135 [Gemmatimonadaceae bacterium]|nr:hypothetical protein [Gemmatimonadaceae bacterium]